MRLLERQLLILALGDVAQDSHDFALGRVIFSIGLVEWPATHLDPDESARTLGVACIASDTELNGTGLAASSRTSDGTEVSRPVGDMNAVEQAIPAKILRGGAK
jgi:hypothetical protein